MSSLGALLSKWPLVRQIREREDGTWLESMSDKTRAVHARIEEVQVARSICPYCGVGCGQLIFHKDGKGGLPNLHPEQPAPDAPCAGASGGHGFEGKIDNR